MSLVERGPASVTHHSLREPLLSMLVRLAAAAAAVAAAAAAAAVAPSPSGSAGS